MAAEKARGRPRKFEIDEAMNQAIQVFWARGYEHTSLENLLAAMKLSKSSFYQTFGSKLELYHRSIDRYVELAVGPTAAPLETGGEGPRHGCYIGLVSMEMGNRDSEAADRAAAGLRAVESRFSYCIAAAEAAGEIPHHGDRRKLARSLTSTFYGIQVMGRARLGREVLEDVVEAALAQLHNPET